MCKIKEKWLEKFDVKGILANFAKICVLAG